MWIARDKQGILLLFRDKPRRVLEMFCGSNGHGYMCRLPNEMFPNVTWDNSPFEVELTLKDFR